VGEVAEQQQAKSSGTEVPEPDLAAPVEFFRRNQNGATRIVSDINRL